ncbi:cytosolic phospholipase A2 gamma-like [Myripristis murdjan]|uniref:cytosolic phospholipase A2 gamma-like n=1 Tax=Myripristis murdjan TaxID=586833 RepID=UPI0011761E0C|nr:cytosolic phospholipase A2 gamma-like [Myripristis murdjan]
MLIPIQDSVPHVALLGSGGGERAAVALLGSLHQMQEEGLLDTVLYLGGVSGSTWAMSSLYSDPMWRDNISRVISTMSGPAVGWDETLAWLKDMKKNDQDFSLTDVWAAMIASTIIKEFDTRRLSEDSLNTTNPYPVYNAIEKTCNTENVTEGKWFEVTPHEAGFTELGLFIETSHLGSKFHAGQLLEERPEMDMVKLQGVLSSALANEEDILEAMPPVIQDLYKLYKALTHVLTTGVEDNTTSSSVSETEQQPQEETSSNQTLKLDKSQAPEEEEKEEEEEEKLDFQWIRENIFPLIKQWEWGTTKNFLYGFPEDSGLHSCLQTEDIHLIDAGLSINIPYPPFLGDRRDIDLIIALEYSAGDMFETVTLARDYAAKVNKPFPEIDDKVLEDKDWPKDCYVFQGEGKQPTIVYMPLFNRNNCKDPEEVQEKMNEFSTFQRAYSQEMISSLLEIAVDNMKNNKDIILKEISKAVERRQNKS